MKIIFQLLLFLPSLYTVSFRGQREHNTVLMPSLATLMSHIGARSYQRGSVTIRRKNRLFIDIISSISALAVAILSLTNTACLMVSGFRRNFFQLSNSYTMLKREHCLLLPARHVNVAVDTGEGACFSLMYSMLKMICKGCNVLYATVHMCRTCSLKWEFPGVSTDQLDDKCLSHMEKEK